MQSHSFGWLTPKRMRALTLAAMCTAGVVSTVGFSGSTPASTAATTPVAAATTQHVAPSARHNR
jgi:hypothetical protein